MKETNRIAIAGDTITIPENTRVIIEGGVVLFESTTHEELEVGKWYWEKCGYLVIVLPDGKFVGFNRDANWCTDIKFKPLKPNEFKLADIEEVESLLIGEAEKKGFNKPHLDHDELWDEQKNGRGGKVIFCFKTGQWAEIIREPLYTNSYGTEFDDGDNFHWVHSDIKIVSGDIFDKNCDVSPWCLFMGTERECHRYIDENWNELNKNSEK